MKRRICLVLGLALAASIVSPAARADDTSAANCRYSSHGAANVKSWLGTRRWDVTHFNWGIWDTHYLHDGSNSIPWETPVDNVRAWADAAREYGGY